MAKVRQFISNHLLWSIVTLVVLILLALFWWGVWRFGWNWTGFYGYPTETQTTTSGNTTIVKSRTLDKTLWDWMGLLIIPLVLAGGAILLNRDQKKRELDIAKDREEERALQGYLEAMTRLLLEEKLLTSEEDEEVRSIARARTLTILNSVNGERKGSILRFLYEAKLIDKLGGEEKTVINLDRADLREADLRAVNLVGADLRRTNLRKADLREANLELAFLEDANLRGANLVGAFLEEADLREANLTEANLELAFLEEANLRGAKYNDATIWPEGFDPVKAGAIYTAK